MTTAAFLVMLAGTLGTIGIAVLALEEGVALIVR
jgi:hypothetical protein